MKICADLECPVGNPAFRRFVVFRDELALAALALPGLRSGRAHMLKERRKRPRMLQAAAACFRLRLHPTVSGCVWLRQEPPQTSL